MSESNKDSNLSRSKQKRMAAEKAREEQRHKKAVTAMWTVLIPVIIVGFIVALVVIHKASQLDFSRYLKDDGTIASINVDDYVSVDYENMSFSHADLDPSDSEIESAVRSAVEEHTTMSQDADRISEEGDIAGISYVSRVDGEIKDNVGSDSDYKYTIGSEEIYEDFDAALIGHKAGDSFSTEISFPEDYFEESLAGKTVTYDITFKGIYDEPDFDDSFVKTYYPERGATTADFRAWVKNDRFSSRLKNEISSSLSLNSVYKAYPDKFMEYQKKVLKAQDEENLQYYNQMYMQYTGNAMYGTVYDMFGVSTEAEYENLLTERAKTKTEKLLSLQYVYTKAGLSLTKDEIKNLVGYEADEKGFKEALDKYGCGYIAQAALDDKVCEYLSSVVKITD